MTQECRKVPIKVRVTSPIAIQWREICVVIPRSPEMQNQKASKAEETDWRSTKRTTQSQERDDHRRKNKVGNKDF